MRKFKKALCFLLCLVSVISLFPTPSAAAYTDVSKYIVKNPDVRDYAASETLQETLQGIFDGNVALYKKDSSNKCEADNKISAPLGSSPVPPGTKRFAGKEGVYRYNSGESCQIYANAVYFALFSETVAYYGGSKAPYSEIYEDGAFKNTKHSEAVCFNQATKKDSSTLISRANFEKWGVCFGAFMRTVKNGSSSGHSMIVLGYDDEYLTTLEGNANGKGVVNVYKIPWTEYENKNRDQCYVHYLVQPTKKYFENIFEEAYPGEKIIEREYHTYLELKVNKADQGIKTRPGMDVTYADSKNIRKAVAGEILVGIGLVRNKAGNYWYKILLDGGTVGYMYAGHLDVVRAMEDKVTLSKPFPENLTAGKKQTVGGSVSAERTKIISVTGCIEDSKGNSFEKKVTDVNGMSFSFKDSAIDKAMTFAQLKKGDCTFTVTVVTTNYYSNGTELQSGQYDLTYTLTYSFKET